MVFLKAGTLKCSRLGSRLSCEASGPQGLHTTARELQTCTFQGPRRFKHHQSSTRRPPERDKKSENGGGRGEKKKEKKKNAKFWPPHPSAPSSPFGPHPSVPTLQPSHPSGPHFFWVRLPTLRCPDPSGPPPFGAPTPRSPTDPGSRTNLTRTAPTQTTPNQTALPSLPDPDRPDPKILKRILKDIKSLCILTEWFLLKDRDLSKVIPIGFQGAIILSQLQLFRLSGVKLLPEERKNRRAVHREKSVKFCTSKT